MPDVNYSLNSVSQQKCVLEAVYFISASQVEFITFAVRHIVCSGNS
jgi:hypothetical protein